MLVSFVCIDQLIFHLQDPVRISESTYKIIR